MTIYDQLLQFPLFQGMSQTELMEVTGHTKFGFSKLSTGKWLAHEGDDCGHLALLTHGTLMAETISDDRKCRVLETLSAPYTLQPDHIFGMTQRYSSSFKALTPCNVITIDKQEVLLLLEAQLVFRLNLINLLATETQRQRHYAWRSAPQTLRERLTRYFFSHTLYPAGSKTFYTLMQYIADQLNDSRLDISRALNEMQSDGLIALHRGRIEIPLLERLLF